MNNLDRTSIIFLTFLSVALLASPTRAQADKAELPKPLLESTPWYDADSGTLIPLPLKNESDDTLHRGSRWLPKAERVQAPKQSSSSSASGQSQAWNGDNAIAWIVLVLLIGLIVFLLVYAFTKADVQVMGNTNNRRKASGEPDAQMLRRMQELPAELQNLSGNLRDQAFAWMQRGEFDRAIIALFGHQLLMLDREGLLRLARGKTNGRYVREVTSADRDTSSQLKTTVDAFERSYFGRHPLTRAEMEAAWRANELMEQRIETRHEVPA